VREIAVSPRRDHAVLLRQGVKGLDVVSLYNLERVATGRSEKGIPRCVSFANDGEAIIVGKFNGNVAVFRQQDRGRYKQDERLLTQHRGRVEDLKALTTCPVVVSAGDDRLVRFTDSSDISLIGEVQAPFGRATSLHLSPDGALMAVGFSQTRSSRAQVSLWDLRGLLAYSTLVNPFAAAAPTAMRDIQGLLEDEGTPRGVHPVLEYAQCVLHHHFQYAIELDAAPTIMAGEFDIEIGE
jgi:WD40 repeat protein